jgi:L-lactate dehydrogenase (cytochrome)
MGRSYLYGLGAGGEAGVEQALTMLTTDLERTMSLCGTRTLAEITPELLALVPFGRQ